MKNDEVALRQRLGEAENEIERLKKELALRTQQLELSHKTLANYSVGIAEYMGLVKMALGDNAPPVKDFCGPYCRVFHEHIR